MEGPKAPGDLPLPRLPLRASIYIDPDGTVQFGALFAELVPVAQALGAAAGLPASDCGLPARASLPAEPAAPAVGAAASNTPGATTAE